MFLLLGLFIGGVAAFKVAQIKKAMAMGASFKLPPVAVTTVTLAPTQWQPTVKSVGSLRAVQGVDVSTDLAGIVREIMFESGRPVKKGDLLVKLDTRQEDAQLKSALASLDLAAAQLSRQKDLLSKKATSQSDYDTASANSDKASATVEEARALIARKVIAAPFDGVLGIRKANIGQFIEAGKPVVSLDSQDPIYIDFSVPQQELHEVALGKKLHVKVAGFPNEVFQGEITAVNSKFDENTRNILVQGTVSNKEGKLRSAMFAGVEVLLPQQDGVISVPASSIVYAPYGDSVYVVKDDEGKEGKHAVQQFVKIGPTRGDQVAILTGLKAGDEIVTSGGFKLSSNAAVKIDNSIKLSNEAQPKPPES